MTKNIKERFKNTKFAKGGGSAFECSDYEEMYADLLAFIEQEVAQALADERKRLVEKIRGMRKRESKYLAQTKAEARNEGFNQALNQAATLLEEPNQ